VIAARKTGLAARVVAAYVRRKVRQSFRGVWLRGALPPPALRILLYANHTSFWDGFVAA
jgi:1-acyl-sn-glycerol-3-phosphate acyltransferase